MGGRRVRTGALGALLLVASACGSSTESSSGTSHACGAASDLGSGFEQCKGGWFHRATATACSGAPSGYCDPSCQSDPRCSQPNVQCKPVGYGGCQCITTCATDADCQSGEVCVCGGQSGICITASCTSDADCGKGLSCASYSSTDTCGFGQTRYGVIMGGLACQSAADACTGDGDCKSGQRCVLDSGKRVCTAPLPCSS